MDFSFFGFVDFVNFLSTNLHIVISIKIFNNLILVADHVRCWNEVVGIGSLHFSIVHSIFVPVCIDSSVINPNSQTKVQNKLHKHCCSNGCWSQLDQWSQLDVFCIKYTHVNLVFVILFCVPLIDDFVGHVRKFVLKAFVQNIVRHVVISRNWAQEKTK